MFVCCCAPEVWCYCDRKRERRGEGGRRPAGDVPLKSLCPCRALSCEFPPSTESRLCAAERSAWECAGPGGAGCGAGCRGPGLAAGPGWGHPRSGSQREWGFGASWGSGMLLAGKFWPCGQPVWGLQVHSLYLEPCGSAAFLPGGAQPLCPTSTAGSSVSRSPWGQCGGRCRGWQLCCPALGGGSGPVPCPACAQGWSESTGPPACGWRRSGSDPTMLLSPAASSFMPVTSGGAGTDPFPRGSAHCVSQPSAVSRPIPQTRRVLFISRSPMLGG